MYSTVKTLSVLALAGSVLAAPAADAPSKVQRRGGWGDWPQGGWGDGGQDGSPTAAWTNWASTATAYVTEAAPPASTPAAETTAPSGGQFYGVPSSGDWSSPAASPTAAASSGSVPTGGNTGNYMDIVSHWRSAYGLPALSQDGTLQGNAQKTADDSVGGLHHELNPGSMAQVLAPGTADDFEHVYVGGWLCEIPSAPALAGVCETESQGWAYDGQTGHAEILTSTSYSKIGCAWSSGTGVWACDLA